MVLFDIDGTLLAGPRDGESAGMRAMHQAIASMAGPREAYRAVEFAGRTDREIARALLIAAGDPSPAKSRVDALVARYLDRLREAVKQRPYSVIGSPREVAAALRERGARVGLGTGNVRAGSAIKLENAGIRDLFDLDKGGYGEDGDTRDAVLETGACRLDPERILPVIVVGDTPHDIRAAHAIGAACIGVPFGRNDAEILRRAGADALVETIDDAVVRAAERLLRPPSRPGP